MKRSSRGMFIKIIALLAAGAALNVAVAWGCFPGKPADWAVIEQREDVDQSNLIEFGLPQFNEVNSDTLRTFGYMEHQYWTFVDPDVNKYPMLYARDIRCGWPLPALHGIRWSPITYDTERKHHVFTQEYIRISAFHLRDGGDSVLPGEREFLPYGPIWPGFAVNTLFYAGVLWMLFAGPFALRRMIRRRRGHCPACAYPIGQNPVCTECGAAVTPKAAIS